ncbi:FliH/SctL family protein [Luteimonas sp. 3794]|uniref:FliH/SctL family protein n=1 Tax=Luteimonas sp. 3794 TaxID=2817730 RepID=UPI002862B11C|nr:FliH/SctL family protein [Luteimonas sp. 3794]MDR6993163.1 flagellar biosynthesis/type III secretory pathway protein FliH [Luteimonas sp. 3794]
MPTPDTTSSPPDRRPPGAAVVFERREFRRGVSAPIVRAAEWQSLGELDTLLARVNALHEEAQAEVQKAREQGYAEGFAEGLERVKQQMTEQLASLNERRARVLGDAAGRIGDLACAIVARIAPDFEASKVVPALVMRAVESAQAEQFLMIRVHPDARAGVEQGLGAVRQAHPGVGVIELVDDESLDPLSCVVVSEAGEVRAGVSQQIEAIRTALAQASAVASA